MSRRISAVKRWEGRMLPMPQGDNFGTIIQAVIALAERPMPVYPDLTDAIGYTRRQGFFYASSLEALGLAERHEDVLFLTANGREYAKAIARGGTTELLMRRQIVLESPIVRMVAEGVGLTPTYPVPEDLMDHEKIARVLEAHYPINEVTAIRRARSIRAWLKGL